MKKILLSLLAICFILSCSNTTTSGPSEEDIATFNQHVEAWKDAISGFSSEE